ncbi:type-F conjugative transfer system pilin assembly protein TraF (plasmid) [Legionella israelensis]|uniref:type-F conjugative transfer system pilin assembly protein TraF n=1 Tax=Legionella israelensis TaxID=454 RepID=UPI0011806B05|nr:type-F conjugative transfer system pilin assembly protein TraF [Legionella israelensis]QDP73727.1 type-F conjugative transfer system pilin assembly protein TraF [Legionella israelensis]
MTKSVLSSLKPVILGLAMLGSWCQAQALESERPAGFLWYNLPKERSPLKKEKRVPFSSLSWQQKDKVLRYYTMEALHKARISHDVKDMERFLAMQHFWLNEASVFSHNFQYALLRRPDFDSTVKNPVSGIGEKLNESRYQTQVDKSIKHLTKAYGLLFFYQGNDAYSQKQAHVLSDFARFHGFSFIPVSVDGKRIESLPQTRLDKGQAAKLNIRHFPSIVLVHPKSGDVLPVASGFVTQDYLTEQMMVIATELKRQAKGEGVLYD